MKKNENLWWGYLHTSGTYQAKRYFEETGKLDIDDAHESPFCKVIVGPFGASNREDALDKVKNLVKKTSPDPLFEIEQMTEVEKDVVRLDFLDWLKDNDHIVDDPQMIWENYITERAQN